jgi:hypothetical protein
VNKPNESRACIHLTIFVSISPRCGNTSEFVRGHPECDSSYSSTNDTKEIKVESQVKAFARLYTIRWPIVQVAVHEEHSKTAWLNHTSGVGHSLAHSLAHSKTHSKRS